MARIVRSTYLFEEVDACDRLVHTHRSEIFAALDKAARLRLWLAVLLCEHAVALLEYEVGDRKVGLQPVDAHHRHAHVAAERGKQFKV